MKVVTLLTLPDEIWINGLRHALQIGDDGYERLSVQIRMKS